MYINAVGPTLADSQSVCPALCEDKHVQSAALCACSCSCLCQWKRAPTCSVGDELWYT